MRPWIWPPAHTRDSASPYVWVRRAVAAARVFDADGTGVAAYVSGNAAAGLRLLLWCLQHSVARLALGRRVRTFSDAGAFASFPR